MLVKRYAAPKKKVLLRLPEELHDAIVHLAQQDYLSITSELNLLLKEAVALRTHVHERNGHGSRPQEPARP